MLNYFYFLARDKTKILILALWMVLAFKPILEGQCNSLSENILWDNPIVSGSSSSSGPLDYCWTNAIWVGYPNSTGAVKFLFSEDTEYVKLQYTALSNVYGSAEHLEIWVDGVFFDLNEANVAISNVVCDNGNGEGGTLVSDGTGYSGLVGVIETTVNDGSGSAEIQFPCGFTTLEVKNVMDSGFPNGSVITINYCKDAIAVNPCNVSPCNSVSGNYELSFLK